MSRLRVDPESDLGPPEGAPERAAWAFELWGRELLAFVDRLLGDRDEAEALTQEAFCRLVASDCEFETQAKLRAWLYRVARNLAYDWTKRHKAALASCLADEDASLFDRCPSDEASRVELDDELRAMRRALSSLDEPYRSTLVLRYLEQWSYAEIAAEDGVSESALRTRVQKGLEMLRTRLAEQPPESVARTDAESRTRLPLRRFRPSG